MISTSRKEQTPMDLNDSIHVEKKQLASCWNLTYIESRALIRLAQIHERENRMATNPKTSAAPALAEEPAKKVKPTKALPTDRINVAKQLEILRAYAAASQYGAKAVSNGEVASMVGMIPETISLGNGFLSSVGFIQKGEGGWIVASDVQAFLRAYEWNKETAANKLAPLIEASWFCQLLSPKLRFRTVEEDEAISILADASGAAPEYKRQLRMLIEFLEATGVVQRDGSQLKLRSSASTPDPDSTRQESPKSSIQPEAPPDTPVGSRPRVSTGFSQMAEGAMRFNVSFNVDMAEMGTWRADRIAAFFNGLAQVLAAKAEVERTAGNVEK